MISEAFHPLQLRPLIEESLREDWGYGDLTTDLCVDSDKNVSAKIIAKEECVIAGIEVAAQVFSVVDSTLQVTPAIQDGSRATSRQELLKVYGHARSILKAERLALNLLSRMSGVATLSRDMVNQLTGTNVCLLDTRKSTPGLRILEKYAARMGGARNHRFGLSDGILIKENHIRAAGGIAQALKRARMGCPALTKIEIETTDIDEVRAALDHGADVIMLDNMTIDQMRAAVQFVRSTERGASVSLEASGNINKNNIRQVAETGVDFISSGSIFHAARWCDLSLLVDIS